MLFRKIVSIVFSAAVVSAQIPSVLYYQGFISTNSVPYTGNADIVFQIYDQPTGGLLLWTSTNSANPTADTTAVSGGVYNYLLGSKNALTNMLWTGNGTFLQVIYRVASGAWTTNAARIQFLSVPYAFAAVRSLDSNPVGTVLAFYGNETHLMNMYNNRYLVCDGRTVGKTGSGAAVSGDQYRDLFVLLFQVNSNVTYANAMSAWQSGQVMTLPDMRGRFLRGMDNGTGRDPDVASRTDEGGNVVGDKAGSVQGDAFGSHTHYVGSGAYVPSGYPGDTFQWGYQSWSGGHNTGNAGGSAETRSKNISVNYIIKY